MSEAELMYECQVCYIMHKESRLIEVKEIKYRIQHGVFPWHICRRCAEKISDALKKREGKNE